MLLQNEINDEEFLWNDFSNFETQAKLDLADMILDELARETAHLVSSF